MSTLGVCRFDGEVDLSPKISKRLPLNSMDEIFNELRDQNFASVGSILSHRTKEISARINVSFTSLIVLATIIRPRVSVGFFVFPKR